MNVLQKLFLILILLIFSMFLLFTIKDPGTSLQDLRSFMPEGKFQISSPSGSPSASPSLTLCPREPENLQGKVNISEEIQKMEDIEKKLEYIKMGGSYYPSLCAPLFNVAIMVAYRWRYNHLVVLLNNLHPILARHNIHYRIFVINQNGNNTFNKGMLWNVGFTEVLKLEQFDCVFLHDVDHLPENDRMLYHCPAQPWHVSGAVDKWGYVNQWPGYVGGVLAMLTTHYKLVNGFSNRFWGWGGEDDDMHNRISMHNLGLKRLDGEKNRMMTLGHTTNETGNEVNPGNMDMKMYSGDNALSGLSSLSTCRYEVEVVTEKLYTNISVTLEMGEKRDPDQ